MCAFLRKRHLKYIKYDAKNWFFLVFLFIFAVVSLAPVKRVFLFFDRKISYIIVTRTKI